MTGNTFTPSLKRSRLLALWPWVLLALVALGVGFWLRYGFIQSTPLGLYCQENKALWWCVLREGLYLFNSQGGWSWLALGGAALALLTRWRWALALGIGAGAAGLVLYNAGPAGAGLVLTLAALLRR